MIDCLEASLCHINQSMCQSYYHRLSDCIQISKDKQVRIMYYYILRKIYYIIPIRVCTNIFIYLFIYLFIHIYLYILKNRNLSEIFLNTTWTSRKNFNFLARVDLRLHQLYLMKTQVETFKELKLFS